MVPAHSHAIHDQNGGTKLASDEGSTRQSHPIHSRRRLDGGPSHLHRQFSTLARQGNAPPGYQESHGREAKHEAREERSHEEKAHAVGTVTARMAFRFPKPSSAYRSARGSVIQVDPSTRNM